MNRNRALRITLITGLLLVVIIGGLLAVTFVQGRGASSGARESAFHRLLREYDFKYGQIAGAGAGLIRRQDFERLDNDLDRLEKEADVVEAWLSVLKRRRQLADDDFRYEDAYRQSSKRAVAAFPHSGPIAAVAAAALVHNAAITPEAEAYLRNTLPLFADSRFTPLRLSLHVLLGDFKNPEQAMASLSRDFTAPEYFTATELEREVIYPDLTILKILAGDTPSAAIDIQTALSAFPSPSLIRLAAEYFYDFGNPPTAGLLRAAELFSLLPDDTAVSRQAEALWLAGYTDNARAVWQMQTAWLMAEPESRNRALYNLAVSAPTDAEEERLLEHLVTQGAHDASRRFGVIRLSRLYEPPQAAALLESEQSSADPLIDLEWIKRRTETTEVSRVIADTWLLLGRYPELEYLYQWGAWYFDLQRNYDETALLLKTAARHGFSGYWVNFHQALQHLHAGNLDDAADELIAAVAQEADDEWAAKATLGRVQEARLSAARALEQYERALAAVINVDYQIASRIQVRIALCLKNQGRTLESRRALEYALEINPDNLTARLELSRFE